MTQTQGVRAAAVAGLFYPARPEDLASMVDELLSRAPAPAAPAPIRAVVSPHAGYVYSGRVAAHGFRALASGPAAGRVRTFVIIGPSHVEAFPFTSVFDGTAYRTPLGDVPVDGALARAVASSHASIRLSAHGHVAPHRGRGEHGIEVQLPFLQRAPGSFSIVPVVMGQQDWESCAALGAAIAGACDPESTVVIASSDLSHFYTADEAGRLDSVFCATLETLDAAALHRAVAEGRCEACGAGPVVAALLATDRGAPRTCRVLARLHSGDVTGDRASVVGYASAIVTAEAS